MGTQVRKRVSRFCRRAFSIKLPNFLRVSLSKRVDNVVDRLYKVKRLRLTILKLSTRKRYEALAAMVTEPNPRIKRLAEARKRSQKVVPKTEIHITAQPGAVINGGPMGSRGLKQNLDVVGINTRIEKTTEQRAKERRQAELEEAARRDAPNPESAALREEIDGLNETVSELRAELETKTEQVAMAEASAKEAQQTIGHRDARIKTLEGEVRKLKGKLNKAVGSEKKLPDVIEEEDLALENAPATARQLPKKRTDAEQTEEVKESEAKTDEES